MNGKSEPQKIRGQIKRIKLSGFGPNSGELTLTIGPPGNTGERCARKFSAIWKTGPWR